jgi:hypothetical protein
MRAEHTKEVCLNLLQYLSGAVLWRHDKDAE